MPETALQSGFTPEAFAAFVQARREPGWLLELRRQAWEIFQALALPDRRAEEWMRTDIRAFHPDEFSLPVADAAETRDRPLLPEPLLTEGVELAGAAASLDSGAYQFRLDPHWASKGVLFGSLDQAVIEHGDALRPHLLRQAIAPGYDKFAALQAACWCGGTLLYVPAGVVVDRPFHVLSALAPGGVDLGRCLVVLGEGADATLLAETAGAEPSAAGLHCGAVELLLGPGSRLCYVNLQNWGAGVWHFAHQKALVGRDASLQWTIGALGSRLAKVNQHVALTGPARRPKSTASCSPTAANTSPTTPCNTTRRRIAPAICSTRGPCKAAPASSGGA